MASLMEKVARLVGALGIEMHGNPSVPLPAAIAQAVAMLGLQSDTKGMNLVQQVDACMAIMFGAPPAAAGGMMHAAAAPMQASVAAPVTTTMKTAPPMAVAYASAVVDTPLAAAAATAARVPALDCAVAGTRSLQPPTSSVRGPAPETSSTWDESTRAGALDREPAATHYEACQMCDDEQVLDKLCVSLFPILSRDLPSSLSRGLPPVNPASCTKS